MNSCVRGRGLFQDEYPLGPPYRRATCACLARRTGRPHAVVGAAAQLDVLDRRLAAGRSRHDVMELDETPFAAAMPVDGDERASPAVPHVDGAPDLGGHVACVLRLAATAARVRSGREFPAHQLVDERG